MTTLKGQAKTPGSGRKKGSVNKTTRAVKDIMQEAFEDRGGMPAMLAWAKTNETEFYKMWIKMLPMTVANAENETFKIDNTAKVQDDIKSQFSDDSKS